MLEPYWGRDGDDPGRVEDIQGDEMPKTSQMRESKFLKQGDVGQDHGSLMTVRGCNPYNVAKEGAEEEKKWCLEFSETDKPLVLNSVNIQLCEKIFGSDDTDRWIGQRLVVYVDPTIMYQGKVTGGLRVRAPKKQSQVPVAPTPLPPADEDMDDSSIPF